MLDAPTRVFWSLVATEIVLLCIAKILTLVGWSHNG
jgi:hypothetical protein